LDSSGREEYEIVRRGTSCWSEQSNEELKKKKKRKGGRCESLLKAPSGRFTEKRIKK
jgi:hypothetical protein